MSALHDDGVHLSSPRPAHSVGRQSCEPMPSPATLSESGQHAAEHSSDVFREFLRDVLTDVPSHHASGGHLMQ